MSGFKPIVVAVVCAAGLAAIAASARDRPARERPVAIEPMTHVDRARHTGYFSDPHAIRLFVVPPDLADSQSFSGTTHELLTCAGRIEPQCFRSSPLTVAAGSLTQLAKAQGTEITAFDNNDVFQDTSGQWQMATTLKVTNPALGSWSVIAHAHPASASSRIPTDWIADTLLIGSFAASTPANYAGKYMTNAGNLYLVYSKRLQDAPPHDGVVAQLMASPTQLVSAVAPVTLIAPETANGGYNSEYYFGLHTKNPFKLIETGDITQVEGKYLIAYSTGAYDKIDYKIGIAWSDTFLPAPGSTYTKMLKLDSAGVWGQPNHLEVRYLLQSQLADWPNDVARQVLAPGVPTVLEDNWGNWYLYFAAYAPSDAPIVKATGDYDGSDRRPYFVKVRFNIPAGATVAATPATDLTSWISTETIRRWVDCQDRV